MVEVGSYRFARSAAGLSETPDRWFISGILTRCRRFAEVEGGMTGRVA
jgi:hypothetical protein